jgi:hypothetical protein
LKALLSMAIDLIAREYVLIEEAFRLQVLVLA